MPASANALSPIFLISWKKSADYTEKSPNFLTVPIAYVG